MPLYDYKCDHCGVEFEVFHSIKETPDVCCPECSNYRCRRLISCGTSFVLNGGGWAKDLYTKKTVDQ